MRKIYCSTDFRYSVLGEQKISNNKEYRLLQFCYIEKIDESTIIYNTMTNQMALLTDEETDEIKKFPNLLSDCLIQLAKDWYIVPVDNNDIKLADQFFQLVNSIIKSNSITSFTILPTLDCNARCFYCYENGYNRDRMTLQTAKDVAKFIITRSNGNDVYIKWFGGEPLYNILAIDTICDELISMGINFSSTMISNAYLFTDNIINKSIEKWRLKGIQVTLDGTEEVYNQIKAYITKDKFSPFIRVTDNIEKLLNANINVQIRLNMSKENYDDLMKLIDWIEKRYTNTSLLNVYTTLLYQSYDLNDDELRELVQLNIKQTAKIIENELYKISLPKEKFSRGCMAQNDSSIVISPTGSLGKCEHFSDGEKACGSIYSNEIDKDCIAYWKHSNIFEECHKCAEYASCGGYDRCPNFKGRCSILKELKEYKVKEQIKYVFGKWKKDNNL